MLIPTLGIQDLEGFVQQPPLHSSQGKDDTKR